MKLFECQHCGQPLYFENTRCESCGRWLGYLPEQATVTALDEEGKAWRALAEPKGLYRFCANAEHYVCNWLIAAEAEDILCSACRHNRIIPDLSIASNLLNWRKVELAKHRLFYTLLLLHLPLTLKPQDPNGLAFDILAAPASGPVTTGHAGGVVTINLAEADDVERERQRNDMAEPYRTLLGHFRHEIAHYYWDHLIKDAPHISEFRTLFGDERQNYQQALQQHYAGGPPQDWRDHFISAYASSHPWEDFAETWAHYLHMVDTLETARAFGLRVHPRVTSGADLAAEIDFDPYRAPIDRIVDAWLPLTFAVNSMNRSMGVPDLYPFVLSPPVLVKLSFIHACIHHGGNPGEAATLRAVAAGLKRSVGRPGGL